MKVHELIESLKDHDPEADVHFMRHVTEHYVECPQVTDVEEVHIQPLVKTELGTISFAIAPTPGARGEALVVVLLS